MTTTLYSATVPTYLRILSALQGTITKAEDYCQSQGLAPAELINAELAPDMWDFAKQIRAVTVHSAAALAGAVAGELTPTFGDSPADFAGLRAIVDTALAQVKEVTPEQIDGVVGRDTVVRFGQRTVEFTTEDFLLAFALPNFYFHTSMAYAILRMKGVPLGKGDFLGATPMKAPAAA